MFKISINIRKTQTGREEERERGADVHVIAASTVRMFVCLHKDSNFPVTAVGRSSRERKTRFKSRTRLIPRRKRAHVRAYI